MEISIQQFRLSAVVITFSVALLTAFITSLSTSMIILLAMILAYDLLSTYLEDVRDVNMQKYIKSSHENKSSEVAEITSSLITLTAKLDAMTANVSEVKGDIANLQMANGFKKLK